MYLFLGIPYLLSSSLSDLNHDIYFQKSSHINSNEITENSHQTVSSSENLGESNSETSKENRDQPSNNTQHYSAFINVPVLEFDKSETPKIPVSQSSNSLPNLKSNPSTEVTSNTSVTTRLYQSSKAESEKYLTKVEPPAQTTSENKIRQEKQPGFNMCFVVTFFLCLAIQFCAYGRLLKIPKVSLRIDLSFFSFINV